MYDSENDDTAYSLELSPLKDRNGFFDVSHDVTTYKPELDAYLSEWLPGHVLIDESVCKISQYPLDGFFDFILLASYTSQPINNNLDISIYYSGFIINYPEIPALEVLGIDKELLLQPISKVIDKDSLPDLLKHASCALNLKNLSDMLSRTQKAMAQADGSIQWENDYTSHKGIANKVARLKHHFIQVGFLNQSEAFGDACGIADGLFCLSVSPESFTHYGDGVTQADYGHTSYVSDKLSPGEMIALKDIEGLYSIVKPTDEMRAQIQARLDADTSPPKGSFDAIKGVKVAEYRYKILAMQVLKKNDCDPVYLYAVEESNHHPQNPYFECAADGSEKSVWIRAEQIDTDGNILLNGDEAFWAAGINPNYLHYGHTSESEYYEDDTNKVILQLELSYLSGMVSHTQTMQQSDVNTDVVRTTNRDPVTAAQAVIDRRFEITQMSARQLDEYKLYSRAWHDESDQAEYGCDIAAGLIVIDHAPYASGALRHYSVITQVFKHKKPLPEGVEWDDDDEGSEQVFLVDKYDHSCKEPAMPIFHGLCIDDDYLPLDLNEHFNVYGGFDDTYCEYSMCRNDNRIMLTPDALRAYLDYVNLMNNSDNDLRLYRKLGVFNLSNYFDTKQVAQRKRRLDNKV